MRRTDTWHSTVHSHQYFINRIHPEVQVHKRLTGGSRQRDSRKTVNALYRKHYDKLVYEADDYLDRWEAGKP